MKWTPAHTQLREALTELYENPENARRMAREAGVRTISIHFSNQAENNWHAIIDEAMKQGVLQQVIDKARAAYPNDDNLAKAAAALSPPTSTDTQDAPADPLQGRKSELITALLKFSITETPQGRTSLLDGIPGSDTLSRDMNIARHDLDLIISQLVKRGRMTNGHWPLVILLDNAMPFVKGYEGEQTLTDIRRLLTQR